MHLFLIRHGQSFVNLPGWDGSNPDAGLTELGHQQAQALATWLVNELPAVDSIYCSTMQRARQTAAPLAAQYGRPVNFDNRLREIGASRYDHQPWPKELLPGRYADYWASERPFASVTPIIDGGESMMHFRTRVGLFIEEMVGNHRHQTVLVVCHGGVIEVVFDHVFNIGPWRRCEVWNNNTGIGHFEYVEHPGRETWRLHYHNRTDHFANLSQPVPLETV